MTTPRIHPSHKWLMEHGWKRDEDVRFGNRIQARWFHPRNGGRTYSTSEAESNERYHQIRKRLADDTGSIPLESAFLFVPMAYLLTAIRSTFQIGGRN